MNLCIAHVQLISFSIGKFSFLNSHRQITFTLTKPTNANENYSRLLDDCLRAKNYLSSCLAVFKPLAMWQPPIQHNNNNDIPNSNNNIQDNFCAKRFLISPFGAYGAEEVEQTKRICFRFYFFQLLF